MTDGGALAVVPGDQSAAATNSWWGDNWVQVVALVVGAATLLVLAVSGVALPVSYWQMSNRPNVIVSPDFERGYASVRVRNEGRAAARNVRIDRLAGVRRRRREP